MLVDVVPCRGDGELTKRRIRLKRDDDARGERGETSLLVPLRGDVSVERVVLAVGSTTAIWRCGDELSAATRRRLLFASLERRNASCDGERGIVAATAAEFAATAAAAMSLLLSPPPLLTLLTPPPLLSTLP